MPPAGPASSELDNMSLPVEDVETSPITVNDDVEDGEAKGQDGDEQVEMDEQTKKTAATGQASTKGRLFGIRKAQRPFAYHIQHYDYEEKYPEDPYGEEASPNARVWRTYLDEADADMIENWRDTTDVHLVFSGLFSAVVTTFVAQTSGSLQPNYSQAAVTLLSEQIAVLRAMAANISIATIPPSNLGAQSSASPGALDLWVNGLWFSSLSFSLATALVAVLIKQWIQHYVSVVYGSARDHVRIRQYRYLGLEIWHVPYIVGLLPTLLHFSLFLYFSGLILFLAPLDTRIASITALIAALSLAFYLVTNVLPVWFPQCPYKTPLTMLSISLSSRLLDFAHNLVLWIRHLLLNNRSPLRISKHRRSVLQAMKDAEATEMAKNVDEIDANALSWLHSTSSDPTIQSIAIQAIAGLRLGFAKFNVLRDSIDVDLLRDISRYTKSDDFDENERIQARAERLARSHLRLTPIQEDGFLGAEALSSSETFLQLLKANSPRLSALVSCAIYDPSLPTYRSERAPYRQLEKDKSAASNLHIPIWQRLLLCSMVHHRVRGSALGWDHAISLMHSFFKAVEDRDPFVPIETWLAKWYKSHLELPRFLDIRPYDLAWRICLEQHLDLSTKPQLYRKVVAVSGWSLWALHASFAGIWWLSERLRTSGVHPDPDFVLRSYVHGRDIDYEPVYMKLMEERFGPGSAVSYVQRVDGFPVYAPYLSPFQTYPSQISSQPLDEVGTKVKLIANTPTLSLLPRSRTLGKVKSMLCGHVDSGAVALDCPV